MKILYPENSLFFLLLIPAVIIIFLAFYYGKNKLHYIYGQEMFQKKYNQYIIKYFFTSLAFIFSLFFLVFSILGITWQGKVFQDKREKIDLALLMDISHSMLVRDEGISRLEQVQILGLKLLNELDNFRYSLTVFKGRGNLLIPMTEDIISGKSILKVLSPVLMTAPGTGIQEGFKTALDSFPENEERYQVLILFTDGEDSNYSTSEIKKWLRNKRTEIILLPFGTEQGGQIPLGNGKYLENQQGEIVISQMDLSGINKLAEVLGARIFHQHERGALLDYLASLSQKKADTTRSIIIESVPQYRPFLFIALLLFVLGFFIRKFEWKN